MASQGPLSPSSGTNDSSTGTFAWTGPENIVSSNNSYASVNTPGQLSNYLVGSGYGFSLPDGVVILGITVEIERKSPFSTVKDNIVKIIKGGVISGTDKADTSTIWPSGDTYKTYGGSSDLWGLTWTSGDINASNFGVALSANNFSSDTGADGLVDHMRITVSYATVDGAGGPSNDDNASQVLYGVSHLDGVTPVQVGFLSSGAMMVDAVTEIAFDPEVGAARTKNGKAIATATSSSDDTTIMPWVVNAYTGAVLIDQ